MFHPLVETWFRERFGEPTEPQRLGWPEIAAGRHTLIAAPTGSGKTLTAFLFCLDRLLREALDGRLADGVRVVYISPLRALSNDIHRNLEVPLAELRQAALDAGYEPQPIRAVVRTGDTPNRERAAMLRRPPHLLVTTPESLYLLLTSVKGREMLRGVETVIVDEIHALARDKRGSHLSITLERLAHLCEKPLQRTGLSATQAPIEEIAKFLVGAGAPEMGSVEWEVGNGSGGTTEGRRQQAEFSHSVASSPAHSTTPHFPFRIPHCSIVDAGHQRHLDLNVDVPPSELEAVCSMEQWGEVYERLSQHIRSHRSTLVFVNTRKLAERVAHQLRQTLGEEAVAAHHGSLARQLRLDSEERLKRGELKAIVATASLEMGIDVGYIDLVCQIGSPRSIATFLQRVGRSGHSLGLIPKGRLFPLTRDELIECIALVRAVRAGRLDAIEIPVAPLDLLAQQIVAMCAAEEWSEDDLFKLVRRAWPYRNLPRAEFNRIVTMLSDGITPANRAGAWLHRDVMAGRLKARRGARIVAITCGGAIPELGDFRVVTENDGTFVGTVNEDFALESNSGDVFLLGNASWRVRYVRGSVVYVSDADGAPATVPFWLGEAPGRTIELSQEVSRLREDIAHEVGSLENRLKPPALPGGNGAANGDDLEPDLSRAIAWLQNDCQIEEFAATQAVRYVAAQVAAIGLVPTLNRIVFERFFDESGGTQLVVHAPWGARVNRAWGFAFRKRFCRSFDFELQASADEDGIVLSLGPQHSFPVESLFGMLTPENGKALLEQALLAAPVFQTRWRWSVTRSLAVLRNKNGQRVPPNLQRFRSDDLLAAVFPAQAGCLENHHGDTPIPDHPLIHQTFHDCLHEAMDVDRWISLLADIRSGRVELIVRNTREPSPFSHEILNANPYAFLDGAPLEERRARAVTLRRGLSFDSASDLGRLDPEAIAQVRAEAWPEVRDAEELHDTLNSMCLLRDDEAPDWKPHFDELAESGRALTVDVAARVDAAHTAVPAPKFWTVAERWPLVKTLYPDAVAEPEIKLPESVRQNWESPEAIVTLVRGRMQTSGPTTAELLGEKLALEPSRVFAALEAIEAEGTVMRGRFTSSDEWGMEAGERQKAESRKQNSAIPSPVSAATPHSPLPIPHLPIEWCERRLLARIHRRTLDGLRRQIQPVEPCDFIRFLMRWQHVTPGTQWHGRAGVRRALVQLQGFELAAALWERRILPLRCNEYEGRWLDELAMSGELVWGRLCPPKKDVDDGPSGAGLTRAAPISLLLRENLGWLLPHDRASAEAHCRASALAVLEALRQRGALFQHELMSLTGLLPSQLDEAVHELAALGLATADAFTAVRMISGTATDRRRAEKRRRNRRMPREFGPSPSGRWSLFPGLFVAAAEQQAAVSWAEQLLNRWGVVFRDLLDRESAAPAWGQLVQLFRRLEARGEIRGGRFISGVSGEQYATPEAVELLRSVRDEKADDKTVVLAAADPINLCGLITAEPRIPQVHTNTVAIRNGRLIGACLAGVLEWFGEISPNELESLSRRLRLQYHLAEDDETSARPTAAATIRGAARAPFHQPADW